MEPFELPPEIELPDLTEEDYASVGELYPHFTEEQVKDAAYNLDRWIEDSWKQFARIYKAPRVGVNLGRWRMSYILDSLFVTVFLHGLRSDSRLSLEY